MLSFRTFVCLSTLLISFNSFAIIGGKRIRRDDDIAKYVARIWYAEGFCSASIVAPRVLLTAAHCVDVGLQGTGVDPQYLTVEFGNGGFYLYSPKRNVERFYIHPEWESSTEKIRELLKQNKSSFELENHGDMALVVLDDTIPEGYEPVDILQNREDLVSGKEVILAGFGRTATMDPGYLNYVTAHIADSNFGDWEIKIHQTENSGICHGDSGGPAYLEVEGELKLWGVASRVPSRKCEKFGVLGVISEQIGWINEVLETERNSHDL